MDESHAWLVWLGIALVLVAIETATVDFVFLMLAGGALGAAAAAGLGVGVAGQALIAAGVAIGLLFGVRPYLKDRLTIGSGQAMGTQAQVGRSAVVLDRVTTGSGQVKLAGETWSARTRGESIEAGEEVVVVAIEGATAVVSRALAVEA